MEAKRHKAAIFADRRRELRRDKHPAAQRFAQGLDAGGFVDRRPDYREVEPVDRTDVAIKHLAEMECQIDRGGGLSGFAPRRVQPVDSAHCFGRCVECLMAYLVPGRILEWKDRQHAIDRLKAVRRAAGKPTAEVDLALHLGEVLYGNVGAVDRLDFTVIGPAVNEAARIEALCEPLGRKVLVSAEFAAAVGDGCRLVPFGHHSLRGVRDPREIFGLDLDSGVIE